jgi:alpha-mannosidase
MTPKLTLRTSNDLRDRLRRAFLLMAVSLIVASAPLHAQTMKAPDITQVPTLYVVPYAHLDTQWRWEFPQTIGEFLPKTMQTNFDYIEKYPHYIFNWTGANRYRLMKEYYPADYARVTKYVADGRWFPAGSSVEEGDVNLPSAEGVLRQILYGNEFFRHDFGKASNEYMLPDCFGFPASLPSILAHAGIKGFSTQKLSASWQPAPEVGGPNSAEETPAGIPFNVGLWTGPDGKSIIAALNPGSYTSNIFYDISQNPAPGTPLSNEQNWYKRIELDGKVTGVFADYHYIGTGDTGGATRESTAKLLEAIVTQSETVLPAQPQPASAGPVLSTPTSPEIKVGTGPVHVIESAADQMFNDIKPEMTSRMPTYQGDLELINHSAGSLTSQAFHKHLVIENERLADKAEKSSVIAQWMGARSYPQQRLNDAWMLALAGHFHDTAAGTATPRAYQFAWNDDLIAANQFEGVFDDATEAVASGLDTNTQGMPVVVFNALNIPRQDLVAANVTFPRGTPRSVRVRDADGKVVPAQMEDGKVLFLAAMPPVGYAVYDISAADSPSTIETLHVTQSSLENARYRVQLNADGDVSSVFDKSIQRELLSAPIRLAISTDIPSTYAAWNMDFDQEQAAPRAFVGGPATIRIKESGPARVSLEITRNTEGSTFVQTVSLCAGDAGNRVEFANSIDWKTLSANLKATFPLTASNDDATYNWDIGTIQRPTAGPRQFEVASHRWIDLTDRGAAFGATILTGDKNGSDKRDDHTIRLTLLRSPGIKVGKDGHVQGFTYQAVQDFGHHEFTFGLAGHSGDWRRGQTDWQAFRLSDPLVAFEVTRHAGSLGRSFSLMHIDNPRIRVLALKKAEASDEIVLRMVELDGREQSNVSVSFAHQISGAREINGQEQPIGPAEFSNGVLRTSFTPYQPRTFALTMRPQSSSFPSVHSQPVELDYSVAVASNDDNKTQGGGFDGKGDAMPAEMLPHTLQYDGVTFRLAPARTGALNAITAHGQTIHLPTGHYNRIYILAASAEGDQKVAFGVGSRKTILTIQDWSGFIGQWDTGIWKNQPDQDWAISASHAVSEADEEKRPKTHNPVYPDDYGGSAPGYLKPAALCWYASHQHNAEGLNMPYHYSYLFAYPIDLAEDQRTLTLPDNNKVRILAISTAEDGPTVTPVQPLYETLNRSEAMHQQAAQK